MITIDDLKKVDLRVGKVIAAERVEGSEKLLKLEVDLGEKRQIVSGIAKAYTPEAMVGKSVVVVANLEPRILMGFESNGMILAAHAEDNVPVLLTIDGDLPGGSMVS